MLLLLPLAALLLYASSAAAASAGANCTFATTEWCALKNREACSSDPETCGACLGGFVGDPDSNDACVASSAPTITADDDDIYLQVAPGRKVVVQVGTTMIDIGKLLLDLQQTRTALDGALNRIQDLEDNAQQRIKNTCAADETIQRVEANGDVVCKKEYSPDFTVVQRRVQNNCPSGSYVQSINQAGTATCMADKDTVFQLDFGVVQKRLQNGCGAGKFMRSIGENGVPVCEDDQDTPTDFSEINACPVGQTITGFNSDGSTSCATAYAPNFNVVQKRVDGTCPAGATMYGMTALGDPLCQAAPIEEFDDNDATGWSDATLHNFGPNDVMHGIFDKNIPFIQKTYNGLSAHCGLKLKFRYWAIDSWDNNEWATAKIDNKVVWRDTRFVSGDDYIYCLYNWQNYHGDLPSVWSTGGNDDQKCYQDVELIAPHTADSFTLRFESSINDAKTDESWAVSSIHIEVLDKCPPQTISLPPDTADKRWSNPGELLEVEPGLGVVHGIFDVSSQNVERTYQLHHLPHCKINIKARYWAVDSWDNEWARMYVDNAEVWSKMKGGSGCNSGWLSYRGYIPAPFNNNRCYFDFDVTFAHTANQMVVKFNSNINSDKSDESWLFSNLRIAAIGC